MENQTVRVEFQNGNERDFFNVNFFNIQDGHLLLGHQSEVVKETKTWFGTKNDSTTDLTVIALFAHGTWERCYVVDSANRYGVTASVERISR